MSFISVKEASEKFGISERRVQKLCEDNRISGAQMVSNIWLIPKDAEKPRDGRISHTFAKQDLYPLKDLCSQLSISIATGKNWIKLGKIIPSKYVEGVPYFSSEYISKLKTDISSGESKALKSRRNKKFISGNGVYKSYITSTSVNNQLTQQLLDNAREIKLADEHICYIIAEAAIRLLCQAKLSESKQSALESYLKSYLNDEFDLGVVKPLIDDLIGSPQDAETFISQYPSLFNIEYVYEEKEDILGLLYISLKNIGDRKATGAYYTPTNVVKKLIGNLEHTVKSFDQKKIIDPCCGTGNFLLQLPDTVNIEHIYGNDIDLNSVRIARINLALRYEISSIDIIYEHVTNYDFLTTKMEGDYDLIIGNPPWGYDFSAIKAEELKTLFCCIKGKNIESYDVFFEQAINCLSDSGIVSFILPEAILNVKSHMPIRKYITENSSITTLEYLGNAFDQVQCPCVILEVKKSLGLSTTKGMKVILPNKSFIIQTQRDFTPECFSFTTTDDEFSIIHKLMDCSDKEFLLNNADFALGIVTGNNKEYLSPTQSPMTEPILKGADILKYKIDRTKNFIYFNPDKFQQVAPVQYYRAEEKLLYRFISNQLVFAYDNEQTLSLNSCNIVIPKIKEMNIKYILAILNSRITQFIFEKQYNSVKVLRSHIEGLPIPRIGENEQLQIVSLVNQIGACTSPTQIDSIYEDIDQLVADAFSLTEKEYALIKASCNKENLFLH